MSKINIIATLQKGHETHKFQGKGLKNKNQIIYIDKNVQTKITIKDIITIERKADYYLKLNFKKGIKQKGIYKTNYGTLNLTTITENLSYENGEIKITYKQSINESPPETFTYILKFTLDT